MSRCISDQSPEADMPQSCLSPSERRQADPARRAHAEWPVPVWGSFPQNAYPTERRAGRHSQSSHQISFLLYFFPRSRREDNANA